MSCYTFLKNSLNVRQLVIKSKLIDFMGKDSPIPAEIEKCYLKCIFYTLLYMLVDDSSNTRKL